MAFHTADYDTYFFLGDPNVPPIWRWDVWSQLVPSLDPMIASARGTAAVRASQTRQNPRGEVKFGRIGWNEAGHQKWTHASPANAAESASWKFSHLELWAPSWTQCERDRLAPDVFVSINNEAGMRREGQALSYNPVVVFAVISDLARRNVPTVARVVNRLRATLSPKLSGYRRRPWGISWGSGFTNAIQDLGITGLIRPEMRHGVDVDTAWLQEAWDPIPVMETVIDS